ncbi:hypothetical protein [Methylobacterium nigriterrae]|uniref:hypothetical protein n=1 Tax=Methylobacterium nigriterrae TaxID=3127512 RepID=UPI0030133469
MSTTGTPPERLARVSELAARLAEKTLADRMLEHPTPDATLRALADAALLLDAHGQPIPPLALELLTRLFEERRGEAGAADAVAADEPPSEGGSDAAPEEAPGRRLMRLFRALRPGAKT